MTLYPEIQELQPVELQAVQGEEHVELGAWSLGVTLPEFSVMPAREDALTS